MITCATSSRLGTSYMTLSRTSSRIARSPRAPVPRSSARSAIASMASGVNSRSTPSRSNSFLNCLISAFRGSIRIRISASRSSGADRRDHRQPADELRDQTELDQVLRPDVVRTGRPRPACGDSRSLLKPSGRLPTRDAMMWSSPAKAPPTMNSTLVVSIWMKSWCGCLRPPCGGTRRGRALQDLQQRLLHTLARDVAGDRRVLALAGDLVDLVDVDDAGLGLLHVEVSGLDQLEQDVLDVLADVAGLGQRGRVGDGERDVEHLGQRLGEIGLAAAGRARSAGCWTCRARRRRPRPAGPGSRPGPAPACSGCRPRRRGPSWRRSGRSRTPSRNWRIWCGLGRSSSRPTSVPSENSSSMISLQRSMHSSQM